jgi:oxepin-CoA hydrolase/3-oxo-5,6-dehydrosuberyl-CoA semialdehyde dehydrogenase
MKQLSSFLAGQWRRGAGDEIPLGNPTTEEAIAAVRPATDLGHAVAWGRETGGAALGALTFSQRGELLSALSKLLYENREELIGLAVENGGNTRGDAKFDIDGGLGVLATYARVAKELGDARWFADGDAEPLDRSGKIRARHVYLPRPGLAVHINAFNFPAWGLLGKAAVALVAGMPVLAKPATSTCLVAHRIAEIVTGPGVLPAGAFQLLAGPVGDLLAHLGPADVVAFTGSADTGIQIRSDANVLRRNVRVNVEADSLNAAIVGPDAAPGSELFDLLVRDAVTEIGQKAGQKCTATRRLLVPRDRLGDVREVLLDRLNEIAEKTGDPADKDTRMGPLATRRQLEDARSGIGRLAEHATIVRGDPNRRGFRGVPEGRGWFLEPVVLEANAEAALDERAAFHRHEVFGPVCTIVPYDGSVDQAARIVALGGGSLVSTIYSDDRAFVEAALSRVGPWLGRLVLAGEKIAGASFAPGCVFPVANHGGPGRAGGGEELGGRHGLSLYMQRTAVQGGASDLARLIGSP